MMKAKYLFILIVMASVTRLAGQGRMNDFSLTKGDLIENLLFSYYDDYGFNGSVLVVENGELIYENTFGFSDFETEEPLDAYSPFYIASLAKQFIAAAIVKLAEEGKLSLDDPLTKFLPLMPDYYDKVKVHHLLTHTSGVADYFSLGMAQPGITNQDVYKTLIRQRSLEFVPGSKYRYSNSGYILLAMIVEIAAGKKIDVYFDENIFTPLQMNSSFILTDKTINKFRVKGYNNKLKPNDYDLFTVGDGGIYSTARDLYKWEEALNREEFISKESLEKMYTPVTLTNGRTRKYGYGWELGNNTQGRYVYHTGGLAGFRNYLERQLESDCAIIILTNNSFSQVIDLRNTIVKILDGRLEAIPENIK